MKQSRILFSLLLALLLLFSACGLPPTPPETEEEFLSETLSDQKATLENKTQEESADQTGKAENKPDPAPEHNSNQVPEKKPDRFDPSSLPSYTGSPFAIIHENVPFFTPEECTTTSFESYAPLDALGRCGVTIASIGKDLMPTQERDSIGQVKPTGWHTVKYDLVDGKYLYNRCHLIGFQLTGENANTKNLITGTRYLNVEGMLPFENMVADFVKETGYHVMYRVTPVFSGNDLLAKGVLMEALSVEDKGEGISFCVFCFNVQPGIDISYATGASSLAATPPVTTTKTVTTTTKAVTTTTSSQEQTFHYILNTNSKKIHYPSCHSAARISPENRRESSLSLESLLGQGYTTCGNCF